MPTYTNQAPADTYIQSDAATTNRNGIGFLLVGESNNAVGRVQRALLKFDLSSIPAGAIVSSATLSMWVIGDYSSNARTFSVYRQKRAWVESQATWNIYSTGNNWSSAGGFGANDCEQTSIGDRSFTASEANGEKQFSLTVSAIQEYISGTFTNNGFLVKAATETDDAYQFDEYGATNPAKLVIEYVLGGQLIIWESD